MVKQWIEHSLTARSRCPGDDQHRLVRLLAQIERASGPFEEQDLAALTA